MNPSKSRSVHRYFEPADTFVQILVCDAATLDVPATPLLNRAAYRRLVVQACLPDLRTDPRAALERLMPDDPLLAEDLLYQLCIEVNPGLDIHTVRLRGAPAAAAAEPRGRAGSQTAAVQTPQQRLRSRTRELARRLRARVAGQEAAIEAVVRAVESCAAGLSAPGRPLGTFLLVGRTGTGKTELARALAAELFADDRQAGLVRIDCAEYALAHEYSKLVGAPPGYVGHEDGGQLSEALLKHPDCVVLFDEVEKAHPKLHNVLLAILEEGVLTDSKGRKVPFERSLVVLTSNAGAQELNAARRSLGFQRERTLGHAELGEITGAALERTFSPEFLGRLDQTVVFADLDLDAARLIALRQLTELAARARGSGLRVAFTPAVARWVAARGFSTEWGARELRRTIRREVEAPLAQLLIARPPAPRELLRVRVQDDALAFDRDP